MSKVYIEDLVVFVTGANRKRGIGRALVEEAINRGAKKVYATARDSVQLGDLVAKYKEKVIPVQLDVTNPEQIQRVAQECADTQVLINNAGVCAFKGCCENYSEESAQREMAVNYFAPLHLIQAFFKHLISNGKGTIVNVISIAGLRAFPVAATYSTSKAALFSLTQSVRAELFDQGVSVFGIYPGPIATDMTDSLEVEKETSTTAAKRIFEGMEQGIEDITPDDFADTFRGYLQKDSMATKAIEKEFDDFV